MLRYPLGRAGAFTIPDGVTGIGWNAFSGCMDLTDLIVPNSVKIIGRNAFNPTNSLRNVTISNGVTDIFGYAFLGCAAVSILVPASVTYIDEGAFTKRPTIYGVAGSRVEAYAKENDLSFSTGSPEDITEFESRTSAAIALTTIASKVRV